MIHATAVIDPTARLEENVSVGAFAVIGPEVEIGAGTRIGTHAVIEGYTRLGRDNQIHTHACLGGAPQDISYKGEPTRLEIGDRNIIREFVTVHRGTPKGHGVTRVGNDNMLMAYTHVAHDCVLGDRIAMANGATLAGHVSIGSYANIGGLSAVHQFARVGAYAMLGGGTMASLDIPPYSMAAGNHAKLYGLNQRGLQRNGFSPEEIHTLKRAHRVLFRSGLLLQEAIAALQEQGLASAHVEHLVEFVHDSRRGITR
jgi:UDP-N-acetylglucosamine acyltransferase